MRRSPGQHRLLARAEGLRKAAKSFGCDAAGRCDGGLYPRVCIATCPTLCDAVIMSFRKASDRRPVICYQILYNEVTDNLPQYATLKAMGFGPNYLIQTIMEEAAVLSVIGFLPGLGLSFLIYDITADATRLIMEFSLLSIFSIFCLTFFMCLFAGYLAMKKVLKLDPAELY